MSNPNNALGTNAAFGGRTSVNAFNDVLGTFNGPGILSGWSCSPSSGLTVTLGGNGAVRDVAIAEDSAGNRTTVNNISKAPISVTMDAAPASNSRIDAIVAYIESSPSSNALTDNPDVVNLLVVDGTASSTPTAPNDSAIRTAITADGAAGTTAYYVVLAYITIAAGTTDIDASSISQSKTYIPSVKSIADYLNLSVFTDPTITIVGGTNILSSNEIHCASNADGSLGKIYGRIAFDTTGSNATVTFQSPLRPSTTLTINGVSWNQWYDTSASTWTGLSNNTFTISPSGLITTTITGSVAGRSRRIIFVACLIFAKDFGDEDTPE